MTTLPWMLKGIFDMAYRIRKLMPQRKAIHEYGRLGAVTYVIMKDFLFHFNPLAWRDPCSFAGNSFSLFGLNAVLASFQRRPSPAMATMPINTAPANSINATNMVETISRISDMFLYWADFLRCLSSLSTTRGICQTANGRLDIKCTSWWTACS